MYMNKLFAVTGLFALAANAVAVAQGATPPGGAAVQPGAVRPAGGSTGSNSMAGGAEEQQQQGNNMPAGSNLMASNADQQQQNENQAIKPAGLSGTEQNGVNTGSMANAQPAAVQPGGTQPGGVQPAGVQPAGVQPAGVQPAGNSAQNVNPNNNPGKNICPFDKTNFGPNLLLAVVKVPDGRQEIGGWIFGSGWCSNYNKISGGTDFCDKSQVEYMHIPLSDKFGDFHDYQCYNNVQVTFDNCGQLDPTTGKYDYSHVTARFTSTVDSSDVIYECKQDRELRACVYNPGRPDSDVSYTAFLACGITAEP